MTFPYPEGNDETKQAADEAAERHPGLARAIGGCCVGWPDEIAKVVYQALVVKVAEYIDGLACKHGDQEIVAYAREQDMGLGRRNYVFISADADPRDVHDDGLDLDWFPVFRNQKDDRCPRCGSTEGNDACPDCHPRRDDTTAVPPR